ncbi:MAG: hypothetical protein J1F18_02900 [Lachnospiraceae bacterium]|nr:hypothetical protein [Lachnospiraceae bacterium]
MDYLDEEVMQFRKSAKKSKYNSLESGMYIKDEIIHFKEVQVLDDKVSIMLPDTFVDMPQEIAKIKYPSEQRPQVIKMNSNASVNFTFSLYETPLNENQIENALEQFREIILRVNPAFIFYDFVISEEKNLGWFDFKSYGLDEQMYNVMYITPIEGKLMHGIFNCMYKDILEWKDAVQQVMLSIVDLTQEKE